MNSTHGKGLVFPGLLLFLLFAANPVARAATSMVQVAPAGALIFSPFSVTIQPGDTVTWVWEDSRHSVTAGTPGHASGLFDSGVENAGFTFSFTFPNPGTFSYYCTPHGACCGMVGSVIVAEGTPTPTPTPTLTPSPTPSPAPGSLSQLLNVSTRLNVQTGDNVLIGGFIISGADPKKVIVRGIGPSLGALGVAGALAEPGLELHDQTGATFESNYNWKDTQESEIDATGLAPADDAESAIVATLETGAYTAIVSGTNSTTGVGLVEVYDLGTTANSQLANISTRGLVEAGDNVMIGGFILGPDTNGSATVIVRAIGPSLTSLGVAGALPDPTLELHDGNGALIASNDNWIDSPEAATISADGLAPTDPAESALLAPSPPGAYTVIVRGINDTTGVALVEVYNLQ